MERSWEEYCFIRLCECSDMSQLTEIVNTLSKQGWRLVSCSSSSDDVLVCMSKTPKPEWGWTGLPGLRRKEDDNKW